jgi:hypothetical protein
MEATMWEKIDDSGLEVWVLPVPAFGPPAADTPYHYIEYVVDPALTSVWPVSASSSTTSRDSSVRQVKPGAFSG